MKCFLRLPSISLLFIFAILFGKNIYPNNTIQNQNEIAKSISTLSKDKVLLLYYYQQKNAGSVLILQQISEYISKFQKRFPEYIIAFHSVNIDQSHTVPTKPACFVACYKNSECIFEELLNPAAFLKTRKVAEKFDNILKQEDVTVSRSLPLSKDPLPAKPTEFDTPLAIAEKNYFRRQY